MAGRKIAAVAVAIVGMGGLIGLSMGSVWAQTAAPIAVPPSVASAAAGSGGSAGIEDFTRDPDMNVPQLSPDGKWLAWVRGHDINVYDIAGDKIRTLTSSEDAPLESVEWVNNDYFVVNLKDDQVHKGRMVTNTVYSPMVMTRDAKFVHVLFAHDNRPVQMIDILPVDGYVDGPAPYAVSATSDHIYMTDITTGKQKIGPRLMTGYLHFFDRSGVERVAEDVEDIKTDYGISHMVLRYRADATHSQSLNLPKQDHLLYLNVSYAEGENSIYWTQLDDLKGEASVWRLDMTSGAKTLVKTSNNKSLDVVLDKGGHLAGFSTERDRVETEWIDPFRSKLVAAVQRMFPKATVTIADMTDDAKVVVFLISAPDSPDSFYLYDTTTKSLDEIGTDYPQLLDQPLGEMSYITYKARDGLEIPAYVIKRKDTPANAPLVVMPHGGPAARDVYDFNYAAEYLASKGYVVLEPQYRGSAGFGDAFQHAGDKHLAQMTTDLEDGVRYLAAQGLIDPAKVCVFGWSWGGYLAEAALAFTPKTYVCGVSGAGVSDLYESLDEHNDFWWGGYSTDYWRSVIGNPSSDRAMIHATSPIEHVDAIQAPLLLIHGTEDQVVDKRQSERMNAAMLKAGKKVTYLPIQYMHHGPHKAAERLEVMKTVDAFIADVFAKADGQTTPAATAPATK